ncbi:MAG: LysR family transcriptional regulator [Oceanicaulis sp. HLUCCA04]|nr:MAG: LysR family transcriptional regulator [Oceanicaulis sp. HLUCCA04]
MPAGAPIHPDLLRAFIAVAETGGFSAAAERLLRGQSAVSLQIKRLEDRLDCRLFDRTSRRVSLTVQGERALEHARRVLAGLEALDAEFLGTEVSGTVRLGAPEDFATVHLPGVLAQFARSYPNVALEVTCELTLKLVERFDAGGLDLVLIKRDPAHARFGLSIWREPLVWVARPGLALPSASIVQLAVSPAPCIYRQRALNALSQARRPAHVSYACASLAGTLAAVRAGLGVTVLPKEMVPEDLEVLYPEQSGLPELEDSEMALIEAPGLSPAAERLKAAILSDLAHVRS